MRLFGKMGMDVRPALSFTARDDGGWLMKITPSKPFSGVATDKIIIVTDAEKQDIIRWKSEGGVIQNYLPHWSGSQRELLLTGMDDDEFHRYLGA